MNFGLTFRSLFALSLQKFHNYLDDGCRIHEVDVGVSVKGYQGRVSTPTLSEAGNHAGQIGPNALCCP